MNPDNVCTLPIAKRLHECELLLWVKGEGR